MTPPILAMTSPLEPSTSSLEQEARQPLPSWVKVSAVAAGSVLFGGLAAAWFYRKTLSRLQEAAAETSDSNFRIEKTHVDEDT
jgi:hypothetical protein